MVFSNEVLDLGKRRVSSVRPNSEGNLDFVFADQSRLVYSELILSASVPYLTADQIISYADDCFILDNGKLHRRGECEYVKD